MFSVVIKELKNHSENVYSGCGRGKSYGQFVGMSRGGNGGERFGIGAGASHSGCRGKGKGYWYV